MDKEYPQYYKDNKELVNFQRRKVFSKVIQHVQGYQTIPYNLHSIGVCVDTMN